MSRQTSRLTAAVLAAILLLASCAGSDGSSTDSDSDSGSGSEAGAGASGNGSDAGAAAGCPPAGGTDERTTSFDEPPPMCIDPDASYVAEVVTTAGSFTIELLAGEAPLAVNNFVFLARNHYYDGVAFHRIIPDFVIQGGDAVGDPPGTGGPGYEFEDELPDDASVYQPGSVAMANAGPDTNGSQFFIVLAPGALDPFYSYFGEVTEGFDTTIQDIAATGTDSGEPTEETLIESITITEE